MLIQFPFFVNSTMIIFILSGKKTFPKLWDMIFMLEHLEVRQHPCPSKSHSGGWIGSSTKMGQDTSGLFFYTALIEVLEIQSYFY
jgi:hypothetical protein